MFSRILVPLDGSALAESALSLAEQFIEGSEGRLILLRVVPYFTVLAADPLLYEEMNRLGEDEALAYLRSIRNDLPDPGKADIVCQVGSAADSILQYSMENDVDLIVMSSHGRSGINRWVYGSVAERIMSQAPCPTLIINARQSSQEGAPSKILVPLDGSGLAEQALHPALDLAQLLDAELYLLSVTTSGELRIETASEAGAFADIENGEVVKAKDYLQDLAENLDYQKVNYDVEIASGSVAEAIMDYAAENGMELIIMSSHGRTGLKRWVYGSVAEKVLRGACCATMIVRNQ
ncbi:MAG: universal stress protein [Candidatus Promineifilaceae bacterium]|jgi:nucleotide-binding universal stress UspA family protein